MRARAQTDQPAVLFLRVPPVEPSRESEYEAWYDEIHIPLRLRLPGFTGARRWDCVKGHTRYLVFYEMADISAMSGHEYLELRRWEASQPAHTFEGAGTTGRPGFERGVYEVRASVRGGGAPHESRAVAVLGYEPSEERLGDFIEWLCSSHLPALANLPGVAFVRYLALTDRDLGTSTGMRTEHPRGLVTVYMDDASIYETTEFRALVALARDMEDKDVEEPYEFLGAMAE